MVGTAMQISRMTRVVPCFVVPSGEEYGNSRTSLSCRDWLILQRIRERAITFWFECTRTIHPRFVPWQWVTMRPPKEYFDAFFDSDFLFFMLVFSRFFFRHFVCGGWPNYRHDYRGSGRKPLRQVPIESVKTLGTQVSIIMDMVWYGRCIYRVLFCPQITWEHNYEKAWTVLVIHLHMQIHIKKLMRFCRQDFASLISYVRLNEQLQGATE